ncbi:hypothetical protein DACRYDRAFT_19771 [Dacryopinax primogenitus]|uniref:Uncharacterized protein n=1 Tax=Dacryopinax primogenitus (strain DJM 731) TaxID=1858805 RepID=M5GGB4_DACPD|nr:uncharacterized protein DACRYDRAFT_19771 [Dacryopinax primogenitus]EJU05193.1 hypothetical protein DACRYDRAFT_19771 [Dacryopinax primogenitus]
MTSIPCDLNITVWAVYYHPAVMCLSVPSCPRLGRNWLLSESVSRPPDSVIYPLQFGRFSGSSLFRFQDPTDRSR